MALGVAAVFAPEAARAAALGRLSIGSALGQPLVAEIEVSSSTPADLTSLSARLAHPDAYRAASLEYAADLTRLEFTVQPRGTGRAVIRVTSATPITEPVLNLLLEVSWASGKLQRQFALLLDPPGYGTQVAAIAAAPSVIPPPAASVPPPAVPMPALRPAVPPTARAIGTPGGAVPAAPAAAPAAAAPAPAARSSARPPAALPQGPLAGSANSYGPVKRGETLGEIAQQVRPEGVPLPQVVAALYAENPGAFQGENMNRLMAGSVLRVPSAEQVKSISLADARKLVAAHLSGQRISLAELGSLPQARGDGTAPEAGKASRGRLSAAIDPARLAPQPGGTDTLKLSRGPDEGRGAASAALAAKQEDLTAREQSLKDARARIVELQQQIRDVERLISLAGTAGSSGAGSAGAAASPGAPAGTGAPLSGVTTTLASAPQPSSDPAKGAGPAAAGDAAAPVSPPVVMPAGPPPPAKARPPAPPPPEPTLLDRLQGDLFWLAALVVLASGIGSILLLRRRQSQPGAASAPVMPEAPRARTPAKAPAASVSPEPKAPEPEEPEFLSALDQGRATAPVVAEADPVAEADSLITYGRYSQAEEVLKTALAGKGNRPQVALRLLELYHAKNDAKSFEKVARELKDSVGASSAIWGKAADLGAQIDASNPLYGYPGSGQSRAMPGVSLAAEVTPAPPAPQVEDTKPPAKEVAPLDFVAAVLSEPKKPPLSPEALDAKAPSLDMPTLDFTVDKPAAPADDASRLADSLLQPAPAAAKPAASASGVGTRLDLAKAYLEIGDKAGAKDLLQDVVKSGNDAQRAEAQKLLASL